ncbi:hypothetical protein FRC06_009332 [Ceratobasidium sp. 370]|nr:hypothetical protein FRC06_009332 [Ceratobasidium sp. 370]
MPLTNVTIDDVSALIQYRGVAGVPWTDSPTSDSQLGYYWSGTYHSSLMHRASATFLFDGVAVYLYASKRSRHGAYGIYLDNQYVANNNGYSLNPLFKELMYSVTGLAAGTHNLTIINIDPSNTTYTEVDYITWTTSMDSSLTETMGTAIPHTPGAMKYSSSGAWTEEQDSDPTMVTSTDGASVTIAFSGNGIVLNGKTGIAYGMFSVRVDNDAPRQLNASSQQTHSTILYRQDNLQSGNHTLTVTNLGGGFTSLSIGSATPIVWSANPNSPPSNPNSPPSNPGSSAPRRINPGVLAAEIVGPVVAVAAIFLFVLWCVRRRRRARRAEQAENETERQRPQSGFLQTTPFVLPYAPQTPSQPYESRKPGMQSQYPPMMYVAGPSSPGLTSTGSTSHGGFDFGNRPGTAGTESFSAGSSSGRGGPASDAGRSPLLGKPVRYPGSTALTDYDAESLRDRDAGPVILPQLPPAYSDARPTLQATSMVATASASTAAPGHTPTAPDPSMYKARPNDTTQPR